MPSVLIEGLFNDNVSSSDYVKYNGRICEERIGKNEEGGSRGQTLTATEANHKISQEGYPACGPRFATATSEIRCRSAST